MYSKCVFEKGMPRVHHQVGIHSILRRKETIIIVDESDEVIMKDPESFVKVIMHDKI